VIVILLLINDNRHPINHATQFHITDLVKRGILVRGPGGGRSTSSSLAKVE
jgi:hypothetical protein